MGDFCGEKHPFCDFPNVHIGVLGHADMHIFFFSSPFGKYFLKKYLTNRAKPYIIGAVSVFITV